MIMNTPNTLTLAKFLRQSRRYLLNAGAVVATIVVATNTHAGRPMVVEDAELLDEKSCQVETFVQRNRGESTEYWVVPSCNPTGNLEISIGGMRERASGERETHGVIQAKTVFREVEPGDWGVGLVVGNEWSRSSRFWNDYYATVPFTFALRDERTLVHANIGWRHERDGRRDFLTAGLGLEYELSERNALSAETFVEDSGRPFYQVGYRHWLVQDRVQFDLSYGSRFGGGRERFATVGFVFVSPPFLP